MNNNTVHGQIKGLIDRILTINQILELYFFTPINRGTLCGVASVMVTHRQMLMGCPVKIIAEAIIDDADI
jgi:hypothetical protein